MMKAAISSLLIEVIAIRVSILSAIPWHSVLVYVRLQKEAVNKANRQRIANMAQAIANKAKKEDENVKKAL